MATNTANQNMGVCGLICDECHIFRAESGEKYGESLNRLKEIEKG